MVEFHMRTEEKIGRALIARSLKLGTAESCTGGLIANLITNVPGSSEYFEGGFIVYGNRAKVLCLDVPGEVIEKNGAVSAATASAMARGVLGRLGVDIAVAVTGIAGPGGESPGKPIGTVFVGLATTERTCVHEYYFSGTRLQIKKQTARAALALVLDCIEGEGAGK